MADQRVDVNCRTGIEGSTPLHLAVEERFASLVQLFLADHRVDVNCKGYKGYTPLQLAALYGRASLVQPFLENQRVDVNCCNWKGITLLHEAVGIDHIEVVRMLLKPSLGERVVEEPLIIAMMMMLAQQLSGINCAIFYSTSISEKAGLGESFIFCTFF